MFKKTLTKRKAPPSGAKVRTKSGNLTSFYKADRVMIAYQTKYRLPIGPYYRKRIMSKQSAKTSSYNVHNPSNLTRLEYEINKDKDLKRIFSKLPNADNYYFLINGFRVIWNITDPDDSEKIIKKVIISCKYQASYDRKYAIIVDNKTQYEKILDSPVLYLDDLDNLAGREEGRPPNQNSND